MPATFHSLPIYILYIIFEQIDSVRDLLCFTSSFRACHELYKRTPTKWEFAAVKNGCPAELWYDFCAVQCALREFAGPITNDNLVEQDHASVVNFLGRYFANKLSHEIDHEDRTAVHEAALMHDRIEWLMRDFVRSAQLEAQDLSGLQARLNLPPAAEGVSPQYDVPADLLYRAYRPPQTLTAVGDLVNGSQNANTAAGFCLQPSERLRLYRGFLRHELCCRVFRSPQRTSEVKGVYGPRQYGAGFLGRFLDWEVDEIACVHQFLRSIVQSAGDHLDRGFKDCVLWLHQCCRELPPSSDFIWMRELVGSDFHLQSTPYRSSVGYLSEGSIIGAGLGYMRRFARADAAGKNSLLRDQIISLDHIGLGLHGVLRRSPVLPPGTPPPPRQWPDDAPRSQLQGPSATFCFALSKSRVESLVSISVDEYLMPHRAIGCVFWDDWRFLNRGLFQNVVLKLDMLNEALAPGWACSRYTRAKTPSAESEVGELRITHGALVQLRDLYGLRTLHFSEVMEW